MKIWGGVWLACLSAACGGGSAPAAGSTGAGVAALGTASPAAEVPASRSWSAEAVDLQPRMAELRARTPAELGFEPGTTGWAASSLAAVGESAPSAGALMHRLTDAWGVADGLGSEVWEVTARVWEEEDAAVGVILQWGFQDDAVAGRDVRVRMRRGAAGWEVAAVEERLHCARGVADAGVCL